MRVIIPLKHDIVVMGQVAGSENYGAHCHLSYARERVGKESGDGIGIESLKKFMDGVISCEGRGC